MSITTITGVRLFDGEQIHEAVDVYLRDGRVGDVSESGRRRPAGEVVAGRGRFLMPGLIDCHVHLVPGSLGLTASYGVTTVLDMFSRPADLAGADRGPGCADLRTSSVGATAPGGHPSLAYGTFPTLGGPDEAEAFVADRVADGATHLKVIHESGFGLPTLDAATITALTAAAHARGLVVAAHVSTAEGAVAVARCGVDVLAHAPFEVMSPSQVDEVASRVRGVVATLSVRDGWPTPRGSLPLSEDPVLAPRLTAGWRDLHEAQATRWLPSEPPDDAAQSATVLALHRAGVRVLAGTDSPNPGLVPGLSLHRELGRLVDAGLTPLEALASATSGPADVFGLSDRGRVAPGLRADLVLVDGDPTRDVTDTGRVVAAWVAGERADASGFAGSEDERSGLSWLTAMTDRILAGVAEWLPAPRDVVRDEDGETLGRLVPGPEGWLPTTTFGAALGEATDEDSAEAVVRERGMASLAEPWRLTAGDRTVDVVLLELTGDRVRVRPVWPDEDDDPAGVWHDLALVELTSVTEGAH